MLDAKGELIFRYLYHYIGCTTLSLRLRINITDKGYPRELRNLEAGEKAATISMPPKQGKSGLALVWASTARQALSHRRWTAAAASVRRVRRRHAGDGVRTLSGEPPASAGPSGGSMPRRTVRRQSTVKFSLPKSGRRKSPGGTI